MIDSLVECGISKDTIDEIRENADDEFYEHIKNYKSCDGFISYLPNTKEMFLV